MLSKAAGLFRNWLTPVLQKKLRIRIVLLVAVGAATNSVAGEVSVDTSIEVGSRFDTNPRYEASTRDFESAWGTLVDARLPLLYRTQRTSISLDPRLVYSFYSDSDKDDLEDRDKYLTGAASWSTQLSSTGASYGITDLALRTSEFLDGGSGGARIFGRDTQQRWFFQPYWQYQFSQTNSMVMNGGYEEVRYTEESASRRFDYDYTDVGTSFQHALNERHTLALQARFTDFDSKSTDLGIGNNSKTNSLSVVYSYAWSERTELSADIGWANTKSETQFSNGFAFKSDSSNFIGNLTATHQSETVEYNVVLGQSITPNSNGSEVLRFNIDGTARKNFSSRITGQLGITAFTQSNVGDESQAFDRNYIRGTLRLNYSLTRRWSVYGSYAYTFDTQKRFLSEDRVVRNHFASMGIRFAGDGWRW